MIAPWNAESPRDGLTFSSCKRIKGAGIFQEFNSLAVSCAFSLSNPPEI